MDINKSIKIIETLANGINPMTKKPMPDKSPYNNIEVTRSMFKILDYVTDAQNKIKNSKIKTEQKKAENLKNGEPERAGVPWPEKEKEELYERFEEGKLISYLSKKHKRTQGAIKAQLKTNGYTDEDFLIRQVLHVPR